MIETCIDTRRFYKQYHPNKRSSYCGDKVIEIVNRGVREDLIPQSFWRSLDDQRVITVARGLFVACGVSSYCDFGFGEFDIGRKEFTLFQYVMTSALLLFSERLLRGELSMGVAGGLLELLPAQILVESSWCHTAKSGAGAYGLAQSMNDSLKITGIPEIDVWNQMKEVVRYYALAYKELFNDGIKWRSGGVKRVLSPLDLNKHIEGEEAIDELRVLLMLGSYVSGRKNMLSIASAFFEGFDLCDYYGGTVLDIYCQVAKSGFEKRNSFGKHSLEYVFKILVALESFFGIEFRSEKIESGGVEQNVSTRSVRKAEIGMGEYVPTNPVPALLVVGLFWFILNRRMKK